MRGAGTWLLVLWSVGCTSRAELSWPVDQPGQHRVGYRAAEVRYQPLGGPERVLRLALWFPTEATVGGKTEYMGVERPGVLNGVRPAGEALPVLLFSHGHLAFAEASGFLPEYFASHGFLAVSPDHTGDTTVNIVDPLATEMYAWRPLDLSAVLDYLYALPSEDSLAGRLSTEVIAAGHSLGGYTVLAAGGAHFPVDPARCMDGTGPGSWCRTMTPLLASRFSQAFLDDRIQAVVPMAPGSIDVLGPEGVSAVAVPTLLVTGGLDSVDGARWFGAMNPGSRWLSVPKASHNSFTDVCELLPGVGGADLCNPEALPAAEVHRLTAAYVLAFARRVLYQDQGSAVSGLLDGTRVLSAEAALTNK